MEKRINWLITSVVVIYPILIIAAVIWYGAVYGIGMFEIMTSVIVYYICNISVGLGFHRLWSHASYKAHPVLEFVLMLTSSITLQGPALAWVSDHKFHHAYADKELDPHTPVKYKNKIKGLLWAHVGWLVYGSLHQRIDRATMKRLGKKKMLMWQYKYYWQLAVFLNFVLPPVLGYALGGTWGSAGVFYLFFALGRALQQQLTFGVNSLCHFRGRKLYADDSSVDVWWLAPLLLGENWHNFHHAFEKDYRNGHQWYHMDVHKWLIYMLSKCGLARDLVKTPELRIEAVKKELVFVSGSRWQEMERIAASLLERARGSIALLEKNVGEFTQSKLDQLRVIEKRSVALLDKVKELRLGGSIGDRLQEKFKKKLEGLELSLDDHIIGIPEL